MSDSTSEPDPSPEAAQPVRGRRRRRARAGLVLLLAVALVAVGLPLLLLSFTGTPVVAPPWLAERIETRLNDRLGDSQLSLDRIELRLGRDFRPRLRMRNVGVFDARGAELARLNEIRAGLQITALMQGGVTLSDVRLSGAQITVRRRADGTFDLSLGGGSGTSGTLAGVLDGLDQAFAKAPLSELETINAEELTITLEDSRSGRLWQVTGGKITLNHSDDSVDLTVSADVFNGTEELATAVIGFRTEKGSPQASLTATFENAAAKDIAAQAPALAFLAVLDAQISGALRATIDTQGVLEGLAGTLVVGKGAVQPTPDTPPILFDGARAYMSFNPAKQAISFSQVSVKSEAATLTAEGQALLRDFNAGWPSALVGQFSLSNAILRPKGMFAEPMKFARGAVDFRLRLDPFSIDIGQVALINEEQRFNGSGRVRTDDTGWDVALDLNLNTIPLDRLMALWPVAVAAGARDWLNKNVLHGNISEVSGAFRLATGGQPEVSVSYLYSGARVKAMATLPPIENGAGYASLSGKSYTMVIEQGEMTAPRGGKIDMAGSVFRIADVAVPVPVAEISLNTDSTITAALSLLDLKPFELMQKARQPVDVAEGRAQVQAKISVPLLRVVELDDVSYSVTGTMQQMSSDKLVTGRSVTADNLSFRADPGGIQINGPGKLGKVPVNVSWAQAFGAETAGVSRLEGSIELSQAFLDEFNIGLPPGSISGTGVGQIVVDLVRGQPPQFSLVSDMNRMAVRVAALDWSKPRNQTGTLEVTGQLGDTPSIDRISIQAPGLRASGVIDLAPGGALRLAQFDRVTVGDWLDGPVTLTGRGANAPAVAVTSGVIDLRNAAFGTSSDGAGGESGPLTLSLNRLTVSEGIVLTDFRGDFKAGSGLDGRFSAKVNGTAPINGTVVPTPSGAAIRLISDRAGSVLAAADVLSNARGGRLELTLNPTGGTGVYDGRLRIQNTRVVEAPALTEMLNAISIIGLFDQLNSGGISLSDIEGEFQLTPTRLTLYRSSAVGPSLGISLDGIYDLTNERVDMQGVVSPVYFLNGLGQIFSRGRDGLFGFNFRLTGAASDPRIRVNPLSILTPGAFREIFRRAPPEPAKSQ